MIAKSLDAAADDDDADDDDDDADDTAEYVIPETDDGLIYKICIGNYDRYWLEEINHSPKAISYAIFKTTIYLEKISEPGKKYRT